MVIRYAISGFLAFAVIELLNLGYAFALGRLNDPRLEGHIPLVIFILVGAVALVGALFGIVFGAFLLRFRIFNEYCTAIVWLVGSSVMLTVFRKNITALLNLDQVFNFVVLVGASFLFVWLARALPHAGPASAPE
jgi:ABC-type branched-subunit amino acid transport system permease subunit